MNLICVVTLCVSINTYAVPLFGLNQFPAWAAARLSNASLCSTAAPVNLSSSVLIGL